MKFIYKKLIRPILFLIHPEVIHDLISFKGRLLASFPPTYWLFKKLWQFEHQSLEQTVAGIRFKNPIGLSAGFDKDGKLPKAMEMVGFGYTQVGSVTAHPYKGNPGRRLFRLKKSQGLVVYYGLKNQGTPRILERIRKTKPEGINLSFSVAKTNSPETCSSEEAIEDYTSSIREIAESGLAELITINISCPNTYGGEPFTTPERLDNLLQAVEDLGVDLPIFVKMPVDFKWQEFSELLEVISNFTISGVIISNLTKNRDSEAIKDEIPTEIKGGISGKPTKEIANKLIAKTYKHYGDKLTIVGVGGIFSAEDAYAKIKAGASLLQLITGMIYEGPGLIKEIKQGLVEKLEQDGYKHISEAIGADVD